MFAATVAAHITGDELTEQGLDAIERVESARRMPLGLLRARKRTGKEGMSTVTSLLLSTASGSFHGWGEVQEVDRIDHELMGLAVGIGMLNGMLRTFGATTLLPTDPEQALRTLSALVNPTAHRESLMSRSDHELELTRAELTPIATMLADFLFLSDLIRDLLHEHPRTGDHPANALSLAGLQLVGSIANELAPGWQTIPTAMTATGCGRRGRASSGRNWDCRLQNRTG